MPRNQLIQVRRDSATNWQTTNPTLLDGEFGYDITNKLLKIGDGANQWTSLPALVAGSIYPSLPIAKGGTGRTDGAAPPFSFFGLGSDYNIGTLAANTKQSVFNKSVQLAANTAYDVDMLIDYNFTTSGTGTQLGKTYISYAASNGLTLQSSPVGMSGMHVHTYNVSTEAAATATAVASVQTTSGTAPLDSIQTLPGGSGTLTAATHYTRLSFKGFIKTNAAGNLVPQISYDGTSGLTLVTVRAGSYMKLTPVGAGTTTDVQIGNWA